MFGRIETPRSGEKSFSSISRCVDFRSGGIIQAPLKFLIVDDNGINRLLLQKMLQTLFTCETACYEAAKPVLEELKATIGNVTSGATHRSTSSGKQSTSTSCGTPKTYEASSGLLLTSPILIAGALTVILTDIHMPEMGGIELTREIRRDWSATILPIVGKKNVTMLYIYYV